MYCFDSRVRYSEVSEDGKLSLTGIMNYMQDCSTFQSEDCGVGVEWLKKKDRAWLLVAWDIHILRRPELGDHITVITKPYYFEGVAGRRLFELRLKEDETLLVRANSLWCYAQPSRQRPVRLTPEDVEPYGIPDSAEKTRGRQNPFRYIKNILIQIIMLIMASMSIWRMVIFRKGWNQTGYRQNTVSRRILAISCFLLFLSAGIKLRLALEMRKAVCMP